MEKEFEKNYHELEKAHFWFKARRLIVRRIMGNLPKDAYILDVGCSSGVLLEELQQDNYKHVYGVDISEQAIQHCKQNGLENTYVMDAQNIQIPQKFDFIIASDCLEHLKNDRKALANWKELLKYGGTLVVFVPAFNALWSYHDDVNMHFRRYTRKELVQKLKATDLVIKRSGYWNSFLFIPIASVRILSRWLGQKKKGDLNKLPTLNTLYLSILKLENYLLKFLNFPVGVSTFCITKKQEQ